MKTLLEMLIQIKNAQVAGHEKVSIPFSNLKWEAAKILKDRKYIAGVERKKKKINDKSEFEFLEMKMRYAGDKPAIQELKFFSAPSRHIYISAKDINRVKSGFDTLIISTSKGLMTHVEAKKNNLGGELVAGIS